MTSFECRNCSGSGASLVYASVPDRFRGFAGAFDYARCVACGLVQLRSVPEDLGAFYAGYPVHVQRSRISRAVSRFLVGNCYLDEPGRGRSLLDVGCGNGDYMRDMAARGWSATGYDFAAVAGDLDVVVGEAQLAALERKFDLATFNFSFEHFDRPLAIFDLVVKRLRSGGRVYIAVPNIESRESALFRDRWFHLDPPRHVTFFTKQLLRRVLEDRGFTDVATHDLPVPTGFAGSVSYRLWNRFEPTTYLACLAPGLVFQRFVPDGNFAITARHSAP